ncbi:MAG TPA: hypothetical protein VKG84_10850 [Candidatus Acidoferrales bacterium]|nr:hypothetical protein [Candidatus Acidoferrales bacterium]
MRVSLLASVLLAVTASSPPARAASPPPMRYELTYAAAGSATVHVRIDLPAAASPCTLMIPRAVPMGYGEEPYDRFVTNVKAFDAAGKPLQVARAEGPRWSVGTASRVEYDVDVARMEREITTGTDSSRVRPDYAAFLGYSVFGLIEGKEDLPIVLHVVAPKGWPVFSTLAPAGGEMRAGNFYALADAQIVMGPAFHARQVQYAGEKRVPLHLVYYSEVPVDGARLETISGQAVAAMLDYFDVPGPAPFAHYTVFLEFLKPASPKHEYGFGMEHMESFHAALAAADADPAAFPDARLRYHIAHHVAHAWIPKRSYGEGYYPFTWASAPQIDTIWFSEGFAQYAAIAALATTEDQRQQMLDRRFRSVLRETTPELRHMPLRELSLLASTQYATDFRIGQLTFARGGLMAAEMDDYIQSETHGQKTLRDALRFLIAWSAQNHRAFRIEDLPVRFREATGADITPILEKWLAPL